MNAIRISTHLDSEHLYLPEIRPLVGKDVEIIVLEESHRESKAALPADQSPLRGSVLSYENPLEPVAEADWEALQ